MSGGTEKPTERVGEPGRASRNGFADIEAHDSARDDFARLREELDRVMAEKAVLRAELALSEEKLRRSNEVLEKTAAERTARLRRLADELALSEQRERKRLSDFLHDDLQQVLVAAKFACEALEQGLDSGLITRAELERHPQRAELKRLIAGRRK